MSRDFLPVSLPWNRVDKSGECWLWTGCCNDKGYGQIRRSGKVYYVHVLAYVERYGQLPEEHVVDHKDCFNHACVRFDHLQAVTPKQNNENRFGVNRSNKTGVRGVWWNNKEQRYKAVVGHDGKRYSAGTFKSLEEAEKAVVAKRLELFTNNRRDRNGCSQT